MEFLRFLFTFMFSGPRSVVVVYLLVTALVAIPLIISYIREAEYQKYITEKIHALINNNTTVTPEEFFELRNSKVKRSNSIAGKVYNLPGVYVIHNQTKDMYYVGQGKKVLDRVNSHFTGRGNGDVYADYKYNDSFKIGIIPFNNSDFSSLNELERIAIKTYNAYTKGYNKTRGNQGWVF